MSIVTALWIYNVVVALFIIGCLVVPPIVDRIEWGPRPGGRGWKP